MFNSIKSLPANEISNPAVRGIAQELAIESILHNPPQFPSSRDWNGVLQEVTQKFPTVFPEGECSSEYLQPIFHQVFQNMVQAKDKTAISHFVKYTMQELILEKTLKVTATLTRVSQEETKNFVIQYLAINYPKTFPQENRSVEYLKPLPKLP